MTKAKWHWARRNHPRSKPLISFWTHTQKSWINLICGLSGRQTRKQAVVSSTEILRSTDHVAIPQIVRDDHMAGQSGAVASQNSPC